MKGGENATRSQYTDTPGKTLKHFKTTVHGGTPDV
jgi:hypothetical protein